MVAFQRRNRLALRGGRRRIVLRQRIRRNPAFRECTVRAGVADAGQHGDALQRNYVSTTQTHAVQRKIRCASRQFAVRHQIFAVHQRIQRQGELRSRRCFLPVGQLHALDARFRRAPAVMQRVAFQFVVLLADSVACRVRREGSNARQFRFAVRIIRLNGEERLGNVNALFRQVVAHEQEDVPLGLRSGRVQISVLHRCERHHVQPHREAVRCAVQRHLHRDRDGVIPERRHFLAGVIRHFHKAVQVSKAPNVAGNRLIEVVWQCAVIGQAGIAQQVEIIRLHAPLLIHQQPDKRVPHVRRHIPSLFRAHGRPIDSFGLRGKVRDEQRQIQPRFRLFNSVLA